MTSLPSFVELMASLGLDQNTKMPDQPFKSTHSSPSASPRLKGDATPLHSRSKSTHSARESLRPRLARYSPYSSVPSASRRSSLSSLSSRSVERDRSPLRAISASPPPTSALLSRRPVDKLSVNVYGSALDLAANTPISSYVRRKTPGASPTSPTFPQESRDSPPLSPVPMTVPALPALWPNSANSDSFPITPNDHESLSFDNYSFGKPTKSSLRRHHRAVGIRLSMPSRPADFSVQYPRRRSFVHIA